jgi:hypothetical protein
MVVGKITLQTEYGAAEIPVEVLGKGPRPGTAWVRALNGLEPFTKMSHGGPYQDDTSVVSIPLLREVHIEVEASESPVEPEPEETAIELPTPAPDWFLEMAYEDRTYLD